MRSIAQLTMSGSDLPYYHKQGRPVPLPKRGFHRNAGILLFVIVAVFATICLTTLYYIPEISHPDEYNTVYKQFTGGTVRDEEPPLGVKSPETEPATLASVEVKTVKTRDQVVRQPVVREQKKQETVKLTHQTEVESPATSQKKAEPPSLEDKTKVGEGGWADTEKRDKVKEVWTMYLVVCGMHACVCVCVWCTCFCLCEEVGLCTHSSPSLPSHR